MSRVTNFKNNISVLGLLACLGVSLVSAPALCMQESVSEQQIAPEQQVAPEEPSVNLLNKLSAEHRALLAGHPLEDVEHVVEIMKSGQWPVHKAFSRLLEQQGVAGQSAQEEQQPDFAPQRELAEQKYVIELLYAVGTKHRNNGTWHDTKKQENIRLTKYWRCFFIIGTILSAGLVTFGYAVPCMPRPQ